VLLLGSFSDSSGESITATPNHGSAVPSTLSRSTFSSVSRRGTNFSLDPRRKECDLCAPEMNHTIKEVHTWLHFKPLPHFQVATRSVDFAGSRHGSPSPYITRSLVHVFGELGFGLLTGCAHGVDESFRSALEASSFGRKSFIACAFDSHVRRYNLAAGRVVPDGLSPSVALHRRTVWLVRRSSLLILFPDNLKNGRWDLGSTLAFRTAQYNLVPTFVVTVHRQKPVPGYIVVPSNLFGIVEGYWLFPHPASEGGMCEDSW
jgi:hypothetical protein